jgi:hypothetical protein
MIFFLYSIGVQWGNLVHFCRNITLIKNKSKCDLSLRVFNTLTKYKIKHIADRDWKITTEDLFGAIPSVGGVFMVNPFCNVHLITGIFQIQ